MSTVIIAPTSAVAGPASDGHGRLRAVGRRVATTALAVLAVAFVGVAGAMAQQGDISQPVFDDGLQERALGAMQRLNLQAGPNGTLDECAARLGEPDRQVLRVQTEMMLTALACASTYNQANLIPTYENFLFRHAPLVREAQDRIARELQREGGGERALEDFQAVLANEEAQTLSLRGTGTYCRMRASRWDFTMTADPDQFAYYTADLARRTSVTCGRR